MRMRIAAVVVVLSCALLNAGQVVASEAAVQSVTVASASAPAAPVREASPVERGNPLPREQRDGRSTALWVLAIGIVLLPAALIFAVTARSRQGR